MLRHKKNIANIITFSRIIAVAFLLWAMPYKTTFTQTWIIVIYTITCLTDILDGWAARKYKISSDLGKIIDPLADKLLILLFLPLLSIKAITALPVAIILGREFAIMGLRVFAAKQNTIIAASVSGKFKTALTLPVLGILIARIPANPSDVPLLLKPLEKLILWVQNFPEICFTLLIWTMVSVTVWSFLDYLWKFLMAKSSKLKPKQAKKYLVVIPNLITLLNLSCGIFAILHALLQNLSTSCLLILLGCIFDACDGMVARKLNVDSKLGKQLDTSTDLLTFGFAPAVLLYNSLTTNETSTLFVIFALILSMLYATAIAYRLRRFSSQESSPFFKGLPAPGGAGIIVFLCLSVISNNSILFLLVLLLTMILTVSTFQYPHNCVSYTKLGFPIIQKISLFFWLVHIIILIINPAAIKIPIAEINLFFMSIYAASPIWPQSKQSV